MLTFGVPRLRGPFRPYADVITPGLPERDYANRVSLREYQRYDVSPEWLDEVSPHLLKIAVKHRCGFETPRLGVYPAGFTSARPLLSPAAAPTSART